MPWVDKLLRHNPVLMWLERQGWYAGNTFPGATFAIERISERQIEREKPAVDDGDRREDLLDKFRRAKDERPDHIRDQEVVGLSLSTILAGAEARLGPYSCLHPIITGTHSCFRIQRNIFDRGFLLRATHPWLLFQAPRRAGYTPPVSILGHRLCMLPSLLYHRPRAALSPRLRPRSIPLAPFYRVDARTYRATIRSHYLRGVHSWRYYCRMLSLGCAAS